MNALIEQCRRLGIRLRVEGEALAYDAPRGAVTPALLDQLKAHKAAIVAALRRPPAPKVPDGYGTLQDTLMAKQMRALNEGRPLPLACPDPLPPLPAAEPTILPALMPAVSPELAARLSAEDLGDIAAGDIPLGTVQAFEQATIARESEDLREAFEVRSTILQHDAGLEHTEAELESARLTATLARNRGYLWASLRSALAGYPALLSQVARQARAVDALPLGLPVLAVRKDRRVLWQGAFSGAHHVTTTTEDQR